MKFHDGIDFGINGQLIEIDYLFCVVLQIVNPSS